MNCFRKIRFFFRYGTLAPEEMKALKRLVRNHESKAVAGHVSKRWINRISGVPMRELTRIANSIGVTTNTRNKVDYYSLEDARYMLRAVWGE